jgi:hypothetical protein
MLLHRTPPKAGPEVDPTKPVKWLRCLQCNQKFPEDKFKEHQRESKSPCELVSEHDTGRQQQRSLHPRHSGDTFLHSFPPHLPSHFPTAATPPPPSSPNTGE